MDSQVLVFLKDDFTLKSPYFEFGFLSWSTPLVDLTLDSVLNKVIHWVSEESSTENSTLIYSELIMNNIRMKGASCRVLI